MTEERFLKLLTPPTGTVDAVLDTDAYNEIDDQFAIAMLLGMTDRVNLKALYAAPFFNDNSTSPEDGMERSYNEIINLLTLAGREELVPHTYRGSRGYLRSESEAVDSEAARHLVELSRDYTTERPLYIVAIGAITNVASAILLDPTLCERAVVVWLGGHAQHYPHTKEFNMWQDVAAARVVMGCGVPFVQLPCCGTVDKFYTDKYELEHWFSGKGKLADYLVSHVIEQVDSVLSGRVWTRVIWDVTAVAWLINDGERLMKYRLVPTPIPEYDGTYSYDPSRRPCATVYDISRDALYSEMIRLITK